MVIGKQLQPERESADPRKSQPWSADAAFQTFSVAVLSHPMRAGEVTIVDLAGTLRVMVCIDPEQDAADPLHGGASRFGVEQAHIHRQMCSVMVRQTIGLRRAVEDRRDAGGRHDFPRPFGPFDP